MKLKLQPSIYCKTTLKYYPDSSQQVHFTFDSVLVSIVDCIIKSYREIFPRSQYTDLSAVGELSNCARGANKEAKN